MEKINKRWLHDELKAREEAQINKQKNNKSHKKMMRIRELDYCGYWLKEFFLHKMEFSWLNKRKICKIRIVFFMSWLSIL